MAKVLIEGQTIDLDDEIAKNDETLRAALKAAWPDAANATFSRDTKDGLLTVKVTKKAGTKGVNPIIADLLAAPEGVNPAITMRRRIAELEASSSVTMLQIIAMKPEIELAIKQGYQEVRAVVEAKGALLEASPECSNKIPVGF